LKVDSSFQHLWCHVPGGSNLGGKEQEGEEGRERDGGRKANMFHYMISLHNTLVTSQDRNCRANMYLINSWMLWREESECTIRLKRRKFTESPWLLSYKYFCLPSVFHWPVLRVEVGALGWNHGVAMASRVLVSNNRAMST